MKLAATFFLILSFTIAALPVGPTSIIVTPKAPKFTEAERHAELARRRAAVVTKMADKSILVMFSAEPRLYTNDVDYVYRQENNLFYLTGLKQDGATLVITKDGGAATETLFIPKRVPLREAWEGRMYSREQVMALSGLNTIIDASERDAFLQSLAGKKGFVSSQGTTVVSSVPDTIYMLLPDGPQDRDGKREFRLEAELSRSLGSALTVGEEFPVVVRTAYKIENAQPIFAELRLIKSPYELKILQHAVDISTEAHMRAMATVGRADWEYEVHAELEYTFRRRNADFWGYPSIVGCGPNATTLHYVESQSPVKKGEVMLIDAAAEYDHYTADITRSFPVNGKFTKEQAEIYQIVFDAQEAVAKATKPGATFGQLSQIANDEIAKGLARVGLIESPTATFAISRNGQTAQMPQRRLWFIHGLGHWIGMNVHDVGSYDGPLKPGMVYTNEPGIYIREDSLDNVPDTPAGRAFKEKVRPVFEKYKNIGVRIEDDMLVTETGVEWMSGKLPRTIADIEAFMAVAPKQVSLAERIRNNPARILFEQSLAAR